MAQEIERKFLLNGAPGWLANCSRTRIEQGYLAPAGRGREAGGDKPRSYRLKKKEPVAGGVRRIARGRAEAAREELRGAIDGDDLAEAIHAARKDMKKLRAVLRLVRDGLGDEVFRAENRRYRDAARLLGASRDAEVKVETLGALAERFGGEMPGEAALAWRATLERERDEATGGGEGEVRARIDAALAALEAGIAEIPDWPLGADSWELLEPGLSRSYRRSRREWKRTRRDASAASVHEWRKRVKDLWYQLRIVRKAWPAVIDATADQAHELADRLGDHHDLALLADDLGAREVGEDRRALAALIDRRQRELLEDALEIGARLLAEKPKAFRARFSAYWRAWRTE
jgi:CHAD domain-containing protein